MAIPPDNIPQSSQADRLLAQGVDACRKGDFAQGLPLMEQAAALQPAQWRYHYLLGAMYEQAGLLEQAVAATNAAAVIKSDEPEVWFALGGLCMQCGDAEGARRAYRRTVELQPGHMQAFDALGRLNRKQVKAWHFSMMNDAPRNTAYENAIAAQVKGRIVLEIGVGSGLLSMMAARAGAAHVYACEMMPAIAEKAREIIARNGLSDRITILPKISFDLRVDLQELPQRADVLITETFDPHLLGENVLAIVADAKARLLRLDATIIPARASLMAVLVESRELYEQTAVGKVCGFDLSPFNEFKVRPGIVVAANNYAFTPLSPAIEVARYDFAHGVLAGADVQLEIPISRDGDCHALISWLRLDMGEGTVYEASPLAGGMKPKLHWLHGLCTWEKPHAVTAGKPVSVSAHYTPKQFTFAWNG